jgi:hypothetical protein
VVSNAYRQSQGLCSGCPCKHAGPECGSHVAGAGKLAAGRWGQRPLVHGYTVTRPQHLQANSVRGVSHLLCRAASLRTEQLACLGCRCQGAEPTWHCQFTSCQYSCCCSHATLQCCPPIRPPTCDVHWSHHPPTCSSHALTTSWLLPLLLLYQPCSRGHNRPRTICPGIIYTTAVPHAEYINTHMASLGYCCQDF